MQYIEPFCPLKYYFPKLLLLIHQLLCTFERTRDSLYSHNYIKFDKFSYPEQN
jgi:hypothetical protein